MNITERTKISLFAVCLSLPTLAITILWMASVSNKAEGAQKDVAEVKALYQNQNTILMSIKEDMVLVKFKLKIESESYGK